jgi:hypothetical protein
VVYDVAVHFHEQIDLYSEMLAIRRTVVGVVGLFVVFEQELVVAVHVTAKLACTRYMLKAFGHAPFIANGPIDTPVFDRVYARHSIGIICPKRRHSYFSLNDLLCQLRLFFLRNWWEIDEWERTTI